MAGYKCPLLQDLIIDTVISAAISAHWRDPERGFLCACLSYKYIVTLKLHYNINMRIGDGTYFNINDT